MGAHHADYRTPREAQVAAPHFNVGAHRDVGLSQGDADVDNFPPGRSEDNLKRLEVLGGCVTEFHQYVGNPSGACLPSVPNKRAHRVNPNADKGTGSIVSRIEFNGLHVPTWGFKGPFDRIRDHPRVRIHTINVAVRDYTRNRLPTPNHHHSQDQRSSSAHPAHLGTSSAAEPAQVRPQFWSKPNHVV